MIYKTKYGHPIETESVIENITLSDLPPSYIVESKNLSFTISLSNDDLVYGLGQNIRGINKRGWIYNSFCMDDFLHSEDKHGLYGAHNFIIISGKRHFGIFVDIPGSIDFDIGYTHYNEISIHPETKDFYIYVITGPSPDNIVTQFRKIIGQSYIAPKWALGYGMSRWSYMSSAEVMEIIKEHRNNKIPIDSIYLDIDYMDHYKDFTINSTSFGDFDELISNTKHTTNAKPFSIRHPTSGII